MSLQIKKIYLENNKIVSLCILLFTFFLLLSLFSFDIGDYGNYKYPQNKTIKNLCGYLGAVISFYLYEWLGIVSYLLPFFLIGISFFYFKDSKFCIYDWLFISFIISIWGAILVSLVQGKGFKSFNMPSKGGIIGLFFSSILLNFTGKVSAIAIMIIFLALIIYIAFYLWELKISNYIEGESFEKEEKAG